MSRKSRHRGPRSPMKFNTVRRIIRVIDYIIVSAGAAAMFWFSARGDLVDFAWAALVFVICCSIVFSGDNLF